MADDSTTGDAPVSPSFVVSFNIDQMTLGAGAVGLSSPLRQFFGAGGPAAAQQAQPWLPDFELDEVAAQLNLSSGNFGAYVTVSDGNGDPLATVFFFLAPGEQDAAAAGMTLDTPVSLASTPLFGALLSGVRITGFGVSYASQAFAAGDITLPSGVAGLMQAYHALPDGFGLTATVNAGGSTQSLNLPAPDPGDSDAAAVTRVTPAVADGGGAPSVSWFNVQKSLGPLSVERIGVVAASGTLGLAIDASLTTDVVDIDLTGFTVTFTPASGAGAAGVSVSLDGLAVAVSAGELQISGALARTRTPGAADEYDGALLIRIGSYSINAAGSYTVVDGAPSLFAFGIASGEFGGPPAFFVTGLAAGFGVNRALRLPAVDQVGKFPIVEAAQGTGATDIAGALAQLNTGGWVPPNVGEYWVAAGVKFRSFELIDGFALLTVEFGRELVIALLGSATLVLPTGSDGGDPFARVEITLEAVLRPAAGTFSLEALLTPDSFLIDPSCQLTGGMAFDLWFGASPHAGDFVFTLGGYHPLFTPPSYYPAVPRLGLSWHVSENLKVTGDCYFALTPACVMGGGGLSVTFAAGGLRAWFTAQADFLMYWRPFSYDIDVSIDVGVSYTGSIGWFSATFTVELGVSVHLWGPPLSGIAHVNWWVISFDIPIGASSSVKNAQVLDSWDTFAKTSLPAPGSICRPRAGGGLQSVASLPSGKTVWQFSGDQLTLSTETLVPASQVLVDSVAKPPQGGAVNVYPLGNVTVSSVHQVRVTAWTGADWQPGQPLPPSVDVSGWNWQSVPGNLPAALWGQRGSATSPPLNSTRTVVTGVTGVTGTGQAALAGQLVIAAGVLDATEEPPRDLPLPVAPVGGPGPAPDGDSRAEVAATVNAAGVAALRSSLVTAASAAGLAAGLASSPLPALAAEVYTVLTSPPMTGSPGTTGPAAAVPAGAADTAAADARAAEPAARPAAKAVAGGPALLPLLRARYREDPATGPGRDRDDTPARRAPRVSAAVADRWSSSAEHRLLAPDGAPGPDATRAIGPAATMVWDVPPQGRRTLRSDGTGPLWVVGVDAAQRPVQSVLSPSGDRQEAGVPQPGLSYELPVGLTRVAISSPAPAAAGIAGWHGETALRQLASQVLLADGALVRSQSPAAVPGRATGGRPTRRTRRELGVLTARQLVDQNWTKGADGQEQPGWVETWLPGWCRSVVVALRPGQGGRDAAGPPRLSVRYDRDGYPGRGTDLVPAGPADSDGRRWRFLVPPPRSAGPAPGPDDQVIVRAWAPAGWLLDGVSAYPTTAGPAGQPQAEILEPSAARGTAGRVWWT